MPSLDIVSTYDLQEIDNAVNIVKNISIYNSNQDRKLISTHDLLGRSIDSSTGNQIIFHRYNDGFVKKKYIFKWVLFLFFR